MKISFVFSTILSGLSLDAPENSGVLSALLGDGDTPVGDFGCLLAPFFRLRLLMPI